MPTLEPSAFHVEPMRQRMQPQAQEAARSSQKRTVAETVPLCIAPCVPLCAQPTCDSSEALTLKRPRKTDDSHGASKIVNSECAEVCAADSATVQFTDACHATLLYKTRAGSLVRCPPQRVNEDADELDPQPYIEPSSNKTFRRMTWAVLVTREVQKTPLPQMWSELHARTKADAKGFVMIMADTKNGYAALIYKGADKEVHAGTPWEAYKLSSKDPLPFAKALLRCAEVIFTITVEKQERTQTVTALEAIQPCMKMDEVTFKAHLTDLKERKRLGLALSPETEFLVHHPADMEKLKELLLKKERMRNMLKDVDSALRFPWDFTITTKTVTVFRIDPDTLRREVSDRPADAILDSVGVHTVVFFGPPSKGKTPCAKALASLYSRSNKKDKFVETQTSDSLRKLCEYDLLEDGVGVLLDEWQPRRDPCGSQGGGVDHVKNMLDPADAKTIEARFHDYTLPETCARFVTCQNLGKLLSSFQNLTGETDERDLRTLIGDDDDAKALLKRCVFVEVRDHLINLELRKVYKETRCSKGRQLREMANQMRSEGVNELTPQLGLWRQPVETKTQRSVPSFSASAA